MKWEPETRRRGCCIRDSGDALRGGDNDLFVGHPGVTIVGEVAEYSEILTSVEETRPDVAMLLWLVRNELETHLNWSARRIEKLDKQQS